MREPRLQCPAHETNTPRKEKTANRVFARNFSADCGEVADSCRPVFFWLRRSRLGWEERFIVTYQVDEKLSSGPKAKWRP